MSAVVHNRPAQWLKFLSIFWVFGHLLNRACGFLTVLTILHGFIQYTLIVRRVLYRRLAAHNVV